MTGMRANIGHPQQIIPAQLVLDREIPSVRDRGLVLRTVGRIISGDLNRGREDDIFGWRIGSRKRVDLAPVWIAEGAERRGLIDLNAERADVYETIVIDAVLHRIEEHA